MLTIGAAIIVKNEIKNLERCINSIKYLCHQIVVVDTGSTDGTPQLASKLGTDIYFFEWNKNFADARNFAIKHLHTDWVLYIDADEELSYKQDNIHEIIKDNNIGGISVVINNYTDSNLSTSKKHRFTRLFRNHKNIQFQGTIHEQISDSILEQGFNIVESEITINHYGYIEKNSEKEIRNLELLSEEINNKKDDDFLQFHLANTEFSMKNLDNAKIIFEKIHNSKQLSNAQIEETKIKLAQIYLAKNLFQKVIDTLQFYSTDIDTEGLRKSIIGATYLQNKNFRTAKEFYSQPEVMQSNLVDKSILEKANTIFEIMQV